MFEMGISAVERHYQIKCNKYKPEQLTEKLKKILYEEAEKEVAMMNYVNSISMNRMRCSNGY